MDQGGGEPVLEVLEVPGADRVQAQGVFEGSEETVDETEGVAFTDLAVAGSDLLGLDEGPKDLSCKGAMGVLTVLERAMRRFEGTTS